MQWRQWTVASADVASPANLAVECVQEMAHTPATARLLLLSVGGQHTRPPLGRVGEMMNMSGAHVGPYRQHWAQVVATARGGWLTGPTWAGLGLALQILSPLLLF